MGESCGCGWRHGTSPSPPPVGDTARSPALAPEDTVTEAVLRSAHGLTILQRFGIDACCGGHLTLGQAAASAGIPVKTLLCALEPLVSPPTT